MGIIERIEGGQRSREVCMAMDLSASAVCTIFIQKETFMGMAEYLFSNHEHT
jgi:hypothetical protein